MLSGGRKGAWSYERGGALINCILKVLALVVAVTLNVVAWLLNGVLVIIALVAVFSLTTG